MHVLLLRKMQGVLRLTLQLRGAAPVDNGGVVAVGKRGDDRLPGRVPAQVEVRDLPLRAMRQFSTLRGCCLTSSQIYLGSEKALIFCGDVR